MMPARIRLLSLAALLQTALLLAASSCAPSEPTKPQPGKGSTPAAQGQNTPNKDPQGGQPEQVPEPVEVVIEPPKPKAPPPKLHLDQERVFQNTGGGSVHIGHLTIIGRDPATGDLGYATLSNAPAVGGLVGAAAAEVGVAVSGGRANPAWPHEAIRRLRAGEAPQAVADAVAGTDVFANKLKRTQLAILGHDGKIAIASGDKVARRTSTDPFLTGTDCAALCAASKAGDVLPPMIETFEQTVGLPLPERLILAVEAGQAGRTGGGLQQEAVPTSAALVVVRKNGGYDGTTDRFVDLRVDLSREPMVRLRNTYAAWVRGYLQPRLMALVRGSATTDPSYPPNQAWLLRIRRLKPLGEK